MQFNASKCKVLHLGRENQRYAYSMNGTILETTDCEKDVGVCISKDLKPSIQCSKAAGKASTVLGMMARAFHFRDKVTWVKLYKTYVRPHLEYASPAWSPWTRKDTEMLEKVQERAVRMCSGLRGNSYEDRLKELGLDTLEKRRQKTDLTQMWKIIHGHDHIEEGKFFERMRSGQVRHTHATSSEYNVKVKISNLDIRRKFFTVRVIDKWNALPEQIKAAPSVSAFKSAINKHMEG
jgi:hypothetical protein